MIIYGRNPVKELLISNSSRILNIYISKGSNKSFVAEIDGLCKLNNLTVKHLNNIELNRLCDSSKHQGIAAEIEDYRYSTTDDILDASKHKADNQLIVLLDHIEDPQNLGSIIRTVNVLGGDAVIIPKDRSASITPSVVKASAGAVNYVPVARVVNLSREIEVLKDNGFWIVGADQEGEKNITEVEFANLDIGLVIGSEGKGLSKSIKEKCDYVIKISQVGEISSLNASVAAGILIYIIKNNRY